MGRGDYEMTYILGLKSNYFSSYASIVITHFLTVLLEMLCHCCSCKQVIFACFALVCRVLEDAVCAVGGHVTREDSLKDRFEAKSTNDCLEVH